MDDLDDIDALETPLAELPSSGVGSGCKGKGRGRGKAADPKDDSTVERKGLCFICDARKLTNSKFCREHHRHYEAMKYQASAG